MKFLSVGVQNFMSFKSLGYHFPQSGLFFVGGEVVGRPMSSSNGAGKSALFETLCWGLYGKTVRDSDADKLVNRDAAKDCSVIVEFEDDDKNLYMIERYRHDTEHKNELHLMDITGPLTGATTADTQKTIDKLLGMNWLVFSTAVVFGEAASRFTKAKPAEKNEIFDEILMMQIYQDAQAAVKADVNDMESSKRKLESDVELGEGLIENDKFELKRIESHIVKLKSDKKDMEADVAKIEEERAEEKKTRDILQGVVDEFEKEKVKLDASAEELREMMSKKAGERDRELKKLNDAYHALNTKVGVLIQERDKLERILAFSAKKDMEGQRCPTCGVKLTHESVSEAQTHLTADLGTVETNQKLQSELRDEAENAVKAATSRWMKEIDELAQTRLSIDEAIGSRQKKISEQQQSILQLDYKVKTLTQQLDVLVKGHADKEAAALKEQERIKAKLAGSEETIVEAQTLIEKVDEQLIYLRFWVEGFSNKGIKSLLLDELLPELNTRVGYYASALLDDEITIKFETEVRLKSKEMRDKFNVQLFVGDTEIEYNGCSSGEKGRIDAAILLALQSLIFNRSANKSSLVIFDEVFEHLDVVGIERTSNLLTEEANDKAIMVISHQNDLKDYFDNVIIVHNEAGVSTIVQ